MEVVVLRRTFLASCSGILYGSIGAQAQVLVAPIDIVKSFYDGSSKPDWESPFFSTAVRGRYFVKSFRAVIDRAEHKAKGEDWIGFDPISNSQDPGIHDLSISLASDATDKKTVQASFRFEEDPKSTHLDVFYDFVLESSAWKVSDIRGQSSDEGPKQWSVRQMLKGG
jgi:hypothetical protein